VRILPDWKALLYPQVPRRDLVMKSFRTSVTVGCVSAAVVAAAVGLGAPVRADAASPAVGECFALTDAQSYEDYWPTSAPVPCSGRHSIEIARTGRLPADVNAFDYASNQCDVATVWSDLGVNRATNGIVRDPIRLEVFPFAVRGAVGAEPGWVCGIGPIAFRGGKDVALISMTGAVASMSAAQRRALRYCNSAAGGRGAFAPPVTVSCSTVPRWQVPKWIMWGDLYSTYPGEAVIKARAARLCGPGTTFSYPTAKDWPSGSRRSFCYAKHT
jgi:hypothetical protein